MQVLYHYVLKKIEILSVKKLGFFLSLSDLQFLFPKVQRFSQLTFGLTYLLVDDVKHSVKVGISPAHVFDAAIRLKWAL